MTLQPFQIEINRRAPFIGLFESRNAVFEAFHDLAAAEAQTLNGFRLLVRPYRSDSPRPNGLEAI